MSRAPSPSASTFRLYLPDSASVVYLRSLVNLLAMFGLSAEGLLAHVNIDASCLDDVDLRVPKEVIATAWERTATLTGLTDLGLKAAEIAPPGTFAILDHVAAHQPDLDRAARATVKFFRLCDPDLDMRFEIVEAECRIGFRFPSVMSGYSRHWVEAIAGIILGRSRALTATPTLAPLRVSFQHASPDLLTEHERVFGNSIAFEAPRTELVFPVDVLRLPVKDADPFLSRVLTEYAERELAKVPDERSVTAFVRRSLCRRLAIGGLDLPSVAREARCSSRTLQERLRTEGTSFTALVDEVRKEQALKYVANPQLRLVEIPLLLHYSEASPFFRAFRRWTGMTPDQYRAAATAPGTRSGVSAA
jgi:AraC-like DNA-binding protein